jgi:hypothetical protein
MHCCTPRLQRWLDNDRPDRSRPGDWRREVEEFALYLCRRCADDKELDGVRRAGISSWAPASKMLPLAALVSPHRTWHDQVDVVIYAAKFMGLSETGGRGGEGVI